MQTIATLLGIDADSEAGQLLMAALGLRQIVIGEVLSVGPGRMDTDPSEGGAEGDGDEDEEVDMEVDET